MDMPSAKDAARRVEAQQRDLTEMIHNLIKLRQARFSGRLVVTYKDGRIVKAGVKKEG